MEANEVKKKSSWYNVLYPTYKSRSEDFKRIFKDVPDDERLVVDYSCALQREILVHGRLYVSQNYVCFTQISSVGNFSMSTLEGCYIYYQRKNCTRYS